MTGWGAFNSQAKRIEVVETILETLPIQCAVETGTFMGDTTEWLANKGLVVFTVEFDVKNHLKVKKRFSEQPLVHAYQGDSRTFLRDLIVEPRCPLQGVLFYLDAHWYEDLPIREEVALIAKHWRNFVIVIDDFKVPWDSGYGFDAYPPHVGELTREYLRTTDRLGLHWFGPASPSSEETGAKRGTAFLTDSKEFAKALAAMPLLRPWQ